MDTTRRGLLGAAGLVLAGGGTAVATQMNGTDSVSPEDVSLTEQEARDIATDEVGGTVLEVELESEDGTPLYEVETEADDGTVSEVAVDANNGTVLEVEREDESEAEDENEDETEDESEDDD
jgi:uncharacterized membrane protein YkoI